MPSKPTVREKIISDLTEFFSPTHLEVIDESHMHSRRTAAHPETHMKIVIVSDKFKNLSRVKRQQLVYSVVNPLFQFGLHAVSQSTFTSEEWAQEPIKNESPLCAHPVKSKK